MGLYDEFKFKPASFLPHANLQLEELEYWLYIASKVDIKDGYAVIACILQC